MIPALVAAALALGVAGGCATTRTEASADPGAWAVLEPASASATARLAAARIVDAASGSPLARPVSATDPRLCVRLEDGSPRRAGDFAIRLARALLATGRVVLVPDGTVPRVRVIEPDPGSSATVAIDLEEPRGAVLLRLLASPSPD
ncbi:MAG: hypothetical protein JNK02_03355 [Planctomycetes bacterium]|nr:hypothetical protein [Planctomycetota bacterium]